MTMAASPFVNDCLSGRVACVTGGGSGIGFEVTRQLLNAGCRAAIICGRRESFLKKSASILQSELRSNSTNNNQTVAYHVLDVRDAENCQSVAEFIKDKFGRLDILVNGAAGNFLAPANQLSSKGFATVMSIDAMGTFNMSRACYNLLHAATNTSGGNIINISATLHTPATHWQAHASAAKAAVDSLTRSLALEWGPTIRVNGVAPGPIADTPGATKLAPLFDAIGTTSNSILESIPMKRLGNAHEIGHAVVFLCVSDYVTGHTLVVDGGECLYKPPLVDEQLVSFLSRSVEGKSRAQAPKQSKL